MKKIFLLVLSLALVLPHTVYGLTDDLITTDPIAFSYVGRSHAANMIRNLTFTDVAPNHWAGERIARAGALDMLKGDNNGRYNPESRVSNQEALAFVLRVMGLENTAQATAATLRDDFPEGSSLRSLWSLGYLNLAYRNGLITAEQYDDTTLEDQSQLRDVEDAFLREDNALREDVAQWLYQAMLMLDPTLFPANASRQSIYTFSDYQNIDVDRIEAVEALTTNNIMSGSDGRFNPKSPITRAEMAALLANLDTIYLPTAALEKKTGTVGAVLDGQFSTTGIATLGRQFLIRTLDGTVDVLTYALAADSSPQSGTLDAPVYKNGSVSGLISLEEGDRIEYLVNFLTEEVVYVHVTGSTDTPGAVKTVQGTLQAVDAFSYSITIVDTAGKTYTYPVIEGLFTGETINFNGRWRALAALPVGSRVSLHLVNNIVDEITYVGEPTVYQELHGVVLENNPAFGYITFAGDSGNEVTKHYVSGELLAEKKPFYMTSDTLGYISHVFPSFVYNPAAVPVSEIEPGDIIFVRLDPNDPNTITEISAATNYMMRYGKILQFNITGNAAGMLIEYENKQTAWFDLASDIPVTKGGRMVSTGGIMPGDWARLLVNQAILEPGAVLETVKEITIEGGEEHFISNIVKGQLSGINRIQNQIIIQNAQKLAKTGWADYQNLAQYSIAGSDIEFYANDTRITLDYIDRYLKRHDGEVYVALENHFTGEKVRRVTFRDGRDELLGADVIVNANGNGGFMVTGNDGTIATDAGTIVRRFGRLVSGTNILPPDWAVVSLNGYNRAAVVDITDTPDATGVQIIRGRVLSVDEGKSFKVQSMATLVNNSWAFTPVQREFTIDHQTLFLDAGGAVSSIDQFLDYGGDTVADDVFNIIVDGGRAARVIRSNYATTSVRGYIYATADGRISLRDVELFNSSTGRWSAISRTNPTLDVSIAGGGTIIVKENRVINPNGLVNGDLVRVMISAPARPPASGDTLNAVIIRVDR